MSLREKAGIKAADERRAQNARARCQHVFPSGRQCLNFALPGEDHCAGPHRESP